MSAGRWIDSGIPGPGGSRKLRVAPYLDRKSEPEPVKVGKLEERMLELAHFAIEAEYCGSALVDEVEIFLLGEAS